MPRSRFLTVLVSALLLAVTSCGSTQEVAGTDEVGIEPLPAPTGEVLLTIRGAGRPNVGPDVQVDLEGIESVGTSTMIIHEPFLNAELEMTGVLIEDLLAVADVDPDAELVWTALDDYQVRFSGRESGAESAYLATRVNGEPIEVADGGPIRVVFPEPDGTLARDSNQWIWSLYLIEVK